MVVAQLAEQLLLIRIQSFAKLYTEPVFTAGNWKDKNQDKEAENGLFKTKKMFTTKVTAILLTILFLM